MPRGKFASANQNDKTDPVSDALSAWKFLRRHFSGKQLVTSPNVSCFLRLTPPLNLLFPLPLQMQMITVPVPVEWGGYCTPCNVLYGEALPKMGTFCVKILYKGVRGWGSGQSVPVWNFFEYPPPPSPLSHAMFWWIGIFRIWSSGFGILKHNQGKIRGRL